MEQMYNSREEMMNILSYVDFANLCHVITLFPESNKNVVKEDINLTLYRSSRANQ